MICAITIQIWWYDYDTILVVPKLIIFPSNRPKSVCHHHLPTDRTWIVILKRQSCLLLGFPLLHQLWYNPSTWFKSSHPSRNFHTGGEKGGEISVFVVVEVVFLGKASQWKKKRWQMGVFSMNDLRRWWRIRISSFKYFNFMKFSCEIFAWKSVETNKTFQTEKREKSSPFNLSLIGGWTNPFEKYSWNWIISPGRDENKKYLSCHHHLDMNQTQTMHYSWGKSIQNYLV